MAIVKEYVYSDLSYDCKHLDITKHEMGFVCKNCGVVIPRTSYNIFMIGVTEQRKYVVPKMQTTTNLKPHFRYLMRLDKKITTRAEKERKYVKIEIKRITSHLDLVYNTNDMKLINKIVFQYRDWHRKKLPRIKSTNLLEYIVPACLMVINRQKGIMISRRDIIELCDLNPKLFNRTFTMACEFLGFRNDFQINFRNYVLKIIYSLDLPFSVFNDSLFIYKKFHRFFTAGPKNCAVLCCLLAYYSLAEITDFHDHVRFTPFIERFKYQNFIPSRGEALRLLTYLHIPMKNTKDVYQLYKYRNRIFN